MGLACLETVRFLRLASDLESARAALNSLVDVVERGGLALTRDDADQVGEHLAFADASLLRVRDILERDPLLAVLRSSPAMATQIDEARDLAAAAQTLTSQHGKVTGLLERYVEIRESSIGVNRIEGLVTLVASEQSSIKGIMDAIEEGHSKLAELPGRDLIPPLAAARDDLRSQSDRIAFVSEQGKALLTAVPSLFGVGTPKRYLVLALDNAELRPIGGLIAAFATITIADGRLRDLEFRDISAVDRPDQETYVSPPDPVKDHLLGEFTWQVADAGWWPDFDRSAHEARRLYALQTGDQDFDGVIAFTPDFVDALIGVVGPVQVPGTGITVRSGETYLRSLEETEIKNAGPSRKQFLADLASVVLRKVEELPPGGYPALVSALGGAIDRRQLQVLPDEAATRAAMIEVGAYTPFTFEAGSDRLAIMGANVAPVSKLHALLEIDHKLEVVINSDGSANERLVTTYFNRFGPNLPPEFAGVARSFFTGNLGTYERRYLPPDAEVLSVRSVGLDQHVTDPEAVELDSGTLAVGNYLFIKPGIVQLETIYRTPQVIQSSAGHGDESAYRLQFRKQAGRDHDGLVVHVVTPAGAKAIRWTQGGVVGEDFVTFSTTTSVDRAFEVIFTMP